VSPFANRLAKNVAALERWAAREPTTAYRVYDLDMPEVPVAVDRYGPLVLVSEYPSRKQRAPGGFEAQRAEVLAAVGEVLRVSEADVLVRTHVPRPWGEAPPLDEAQGRAVVVEEHGLKLRCVLGRAQDTGLFLDLRPARRWVREAARGKRVLNLFAYTGAFTVHALAGGAARSTTVDLSSTYTAWARDNLALNGFAPSEEHRLLRQDVFAFLEAPEGPYDLVVVDPPSFSSSARMQRRFEVQRDHRALVERLLPALAPGGTLYFSCNLQGFTLDPRLPPSEDLSARSLPRDFRRQVHSLFRFTRPG
jgi:23S rRNA (cytosine1962-C5)-methyltransferase